jgi:6-pyruvoyltetrahydropterin/6-carboxytetrahydropterin synthase
VSTITRRYEIDMGHCLASHAGKCHRPHGHRYVIECTVNGEVHETGEARGMVVDFAELKRTMAAVLDVYDHRFVIEAADPRRGDMVEAFDDGTGDASSGVLVVPYTPTVELLARDWAEQLAKSLHCSVALTVWETPNCRTVVYWPFD